MNFKEFENSIKEGNKPKNLSKVLEALWLAGAGDWDKAHNIVQDLEDKNAAWVHAYLHRVEGDIGNAKYWYRIADKKLFDGDLETERKEIY